MESQMTNPDSRAEGRWAYFSDTEQDTIRQALSRLERDVSDQRGVQALLFELRLAMDDTAR
jgi:hypothetical protein